MKDRRLFMFGRVKWFKSEKGYGFIAGDDGTDVFVHISELKKSGVKTLNEGERVEYKVEQTKKGVQAREVRKV
jgi:CspA family cold shock protein